MQLNCLKLTCLFLLIVLITDSLKAQSIALLQQGKPTSIRGLSVVDDSVAWVSGSKGYIGLTLNGGKNWSWQQVPGYEKADFRDVEAFSGKEAIIMSSGTPALILKTTDGGSSWQVKYRNTDTAYFFDAMDFNNPKHGLVMGDPINNKFVLMETSDKGETWHSFKNQPKAMPGEAAFAASGTCLRVNDSCIMIVTGGSVARWLTLVTNSSDWVSIFLPIKQGKASQGAFSVDSAGFVFVGGDYSKDKDTADGVAVYYDPNIVSIKNGWESSRQGPYGFQSCVEDVPKNSCLSTGTSGSNITTDGGKTWTKIDNTSFNVCRKPKHGKLVLLAGDGGKIGILKL